MKLFMPEGSAVVTLELGLVATDLCVWSSVEREMEKETNGETGWMNRP